MGKETPFFLLSIFLFRILPFSFIYFFLNEPVHSDVGMFMDWALSAKDGKFVYRDFDSPYAPLFSYITALPLWLWNSSKALIVLMIFIEAIVLWFTYKFYKTGFHCIIIYLLLPISFSLIILSGQEDIWMWGIAIMSLWLYRKYKNDFILGISIASGLLITKVLFILVIPATWLFIRDKIKFTSGLLTLGIPVLAFLIWKSEFAFLLPIQQANDPRTPNLWTVLNPFFGSIIHLGSKPLNWIGLVSIPVSTCLVALKFKNKLSFEGFFPRIWVFTYAWMMISQQSSLANYALIYLIPLFFYFDVLENKPSKYIFYIFNFAIIVQPAIWWNIGMPIFSKPAHLLAFLPCCEYILEITIIACLIYYLRKSLKINT